PRLSIAFATLLRLHANRFERDRSGGRSADHSGPGLPSSVHRLPDQPNVFATILRKGESFQLGSAIDSHKSRPRAKLVRKSGARLNVSSVASCLGNSLRGRRFKSAMNPSLLHCGFLRATSELLFDLEVEKSHDEIVYAVIIGLIPVGGERWPGISQIVDPERDRCVRCQAPPTPG